MNAAVSHFTGIELLYLALYDLQVEDDYRQEYNARERELRKQRQKHGNTERCARWKETHPEEYKAYQQGYQRRYRQEHRDEINRRQRERRRQRRYKQHGQKTN